MRAPAGLIGVSEFCVEYEIREIGTGSEVSLRGRLTFDGNVRFREIVEAFVDRSWDTLTIELSELEFIDSAGLGMLMLLRETVAEKGARLALRAPQGQVKRLFTASHFGTLVPVVD